VERIDLTRLDLNLLVALDRFLARASVTEAARDLHLSQPAASRTLGRLRDALGDPLLTRVGRAYVPTERGRALVVPTVEALAAARRVFAPPEAFDPATARGDVVIAMGDEVQHALGATIARAIWERAPGIDLRVRRLAAESVAEGRRGLIDLAIAPDLSPLPAMAGGVDLSELVVKPLYTRRFVVAAAVGRGVLDLDRYVAARHVIVSFEAGGRGFVDELLEPRGLRRRVAASVTTFPAALALVAATDLVATVPGEVAASWPGVEVHPPPLTLPDLKIALMWHPRRTAEVRHAFLREVVGGAVRGREGLRVEA
jgi:DNA-binding transcriptional LysR family regulator